MAKHRADAKKLSVLVFMNTKEINSNFHRPTWACGGADHPHLNNTRQLPSKEYSIGDRYSTAKVGFGLLSERRWRDGVPTRALG